MEMMMQIMAKQMFANNPLFQRAMQMAQGKNEQEIMQIAQNLCGQKGIDINKAFEQFKNQMQGMMPK
jgi:hypothetical protein